MQWTQTSDDNHDHGEYASNDGGVSDESESQSSDETNEDDHHTKTFVVAQPIIRQPNFHLLVMEIRKWLSPK